MNQTATAPDVYRPITDDDGNQFLCPIGAAKPETAGEDCVEVDVAGRYAAAIRIEAA